MVCHLVALVECYVLLVGKSVSVRRGVDKIKCTENARRLNYIDKLSVVITLILAAVILHEQFTIKSIAGCFFIALGTLLMVL